MEVSPENILLLFDKVVWPLIRLIFFISIGLLIANIIESFQWTHRIAKISLPLSRLGRLSDTAGASFSLAFFSGVSANTMLAEAYDKGKLNKKELILANLFNSLPTYFLHLPTIFFITLPLLKSATFVYIGLTLGAAMLRTSSIILISRFLSTPGSPPARKNSFPDREKPGRVAIFQRIRKRFTRRMKKILTLTIPIYIIIFILHQSGLFHKAELLVATHLKIFPWITPQAIGIITLHIAAELTAGLAAASALLTEGLMSTKEVVTALLIGNIVSSPLRAIRHQFPYYAGIFQPKLAMQLLTFNQTFRVGSLILVGLLYVVFF